MPRLGINDMETHNIGGSNFGFSATRIENLGATEYTLGSIIIDVSGSVEPFAREIEECLKIIRRACTRNPRADNMMLRVLLFNHQFSELHGFKPLQDCNDSDYQDKVHPFGSTSLFDATYSAIKATTQYAEQLAKNDFSVNAAVFVVTDGEDNASKFSANMVKDAIQDAIRSEHLESIMPVLVGVNVDKQSGTNRYLEDFKNEAGFQQYVAIEKADEKTLARLGDFISRSISSQSQALGSGGGSKSLAF